MVMALELWCPSWGNLPDQFDKLLFDAVQSMDDGDDSSPKFPKDSSQITEIDAFDQRCEERRLAPHANC